MGLRFSPKPEIKGLYNKLHGGPDFVAYDEYMQTLGAVPSNSVLFDVYGVDSMGGKETLIGTLDLEGELVASAFGDQQLFFRHQKMDDDFKTRPELEKDAESFICPLSPKSWAPTFAKW